MNITNQVKEDLKKLIELNLEDWKSYIQEDCDCDYDCDCECQSNTLTVGLPANGNEWSYQTGDNSFTGGAYSFQYWAVVWFDKETTIEDLYSDLIEDIEQIDIGE